MRLIFADSALDDYLHWQQNDRRMVERINRLIREPVREPFAGIGKPEPLKPALAGYWSRRIDDTNRLVYFASDDELTIIACRLHYGDK